MFELTIQKDTNLFKYRYTYRCAFSKKNQFLEIHKYFLELSMLLQKFPLLVFVLEEHLTMKFSLGQSEVFPLFFSPTLFRSYCFLGAILFFEFFCFPKTKILILSQ